MSRPAARTPPATLGAWKELHSAHGRPIFEAKIGAFYSYKCSCGSRAVVEEANHARGDAAPATIRG